VGGSVIVFYSLYDEANQDVTSVFFQDLFGVTRAWNGQRNLGQQTIEFAISGYGSYEKALKSFEEKLPSLLKLQKQ